MKRSLPTLVLSLITCLGIMHAQGSLTPELLYYKFDGTGTSVPNYASAPPVNTNTATIMGAVTQGPGSTQLCGGSLIGTGNSSANDYLNTNWATNIGTSSWTISFRSNGFSSNAALYYIFGDVNANSFRCFTNGVAGNTNWIIRGGGLIDTYINGGALSTPTMCTYVYDNVANELRGYLNGILVTTVAQTPGAVNLTGAGPFKVMGYSTSVGAPAGGQLDEFRFYSRALTALEVSELYNPFNTSGFLGANQFTCPGDSNYLVFSSLYPYTSIQWSDGSTGDSLLVLNAGTYSVSLSGTCGSGADTIDYISSATTSSMATTNCNMYVAPSGAIFDSSGTYLDTIPNNVGCDSVITINLTLHYATTNVLNPLTCGTSYTAPSGAVYTTSGTYTDTIPNALGCDSVITINFTNQVVNVGVTQTGSSGENLSASQAGASYQWIDCSNLSPVAGATSATFTATSNGSYAVIVDDGTCTDTSTCFVVAGLGLDNTAFAQLVQVYPNPTTGKVFINVGTSNEIFTVELLNNVGQVLQSTLFTNTQTGMLEINETSGLYFVRITKPNGERAVVRIVKN